MFRPRVFVHVFGASLALFLCACATVPYTNRSRLMMISASEESQMGEEAWREIMSKERLSRDPKLNQALARVGGGIVRGVGSDAEGYRWEFKVIESDTANAFALPGGKVAVYSGLFRYFANDAELAAVVGHEIGHVIARHGGERISQGALAQLGGAVLSVALQQSGAPALDLWMQAYGVAANVGAILPYSRVHEYEADYLGMVFMAKAGYDPRAAVSFWVKFSNPEQESNLLEFLSTHPMGSNRVEEMQRRMPEAMQLYERAPARHGLGQSYR